MIGFFSSPRTRYSTALGFVHFSAYVTYLMEQHVTGQISEDEIFEALGRIVIMAGSGFFGSFLSWGIQNLMPYCSSQHSGDENMQIDGASFQQACFENVRHFYDGFSFTSGILSGVFSLFPIVREESQLSALASMSAIGTGAGVGNVFYQNCKKGLGS